VAASHTHQEFGAKTKSLRGEPSPMKSIAEDVTYFASYLQWAALRMSKWPEKRVSLF
jgi:hypothetical protein